MPNPWYKRLVDILPLQFEMRANISMGLYVHFFQLKSMHEPDEPLFRKEEEEEEEVVVPET